MCAPTRPLCPERGARRRRAQRPPAVDDVAIRVLVGLPRGGAVLGDAGPAVVADTFGECRLQALPLLVGEADGVVVLAQRLELTGERVVGLRHVGADARRAVLGDSLVADLGGKVDAVAVGAAV